MTIRTLDSPDLSQLLALYRHLNPEDPHPDDAATETVWSESLTNPRIRYVGGFDGGRLVAACMMCVVPNLTRGCRPYALIENVVTDPLYRRQGWGHAVLAEALSHAWSQNCYKVMLLSGRHDEGVAAFYRTAGFDPDAKRGFVARRGA